jgi:putative membrane protein
MSEKGGGMTYDLLRAGHILSVIAWMIGLMYLPRLFAYHVKATAGSELDLTLQKMEAGLYRLIMNVGMGLAWTFGLALLYVDGTQRLGWGFLTQPWMLVKLSGVVFLTVWHLYLGRARKAFVEGRNTRSERYWRMVNELPFLAAIVMVLAVTTEFTFG